MGEILPAKARPAGSTLARSLVVALVYIALVPLVAALGIIGAATYFPGPTRALMGPALMALLPEAVPTDAAKADEALAKATAAESRLVKIEQDIAALMEKSVPETTGGQTPVEPAKEPVEIGPQIAAALSPVRAETAGRDRMLAALTALTLARAEFLAGNRSVAEREVAIAQGALAPLVEAGGTSPAAEAQENLGRAADALSRDLASAADWLSLSWHSLADALIKAN